MTLTLSVRAGLLAACIVAPGAALAAAPDAADAMMDVASADFVILVASSNTFEIQSSEVATKKATSEDVKAFAGQMIENHTKAAKDLQGALGEAPLPADPLSPRHAGMIALLETADGADFERLYIDMQAGAHMEAVALFRAFSKSGDNDQVASFAKATLPTLEEHEAHIQKIVAMH
jgi:putative membrane protein